jgi:hypothetical protein
VTQTGIEAPADLQFKCRAWPTRVVTDAVHTVLYGHGRGKSLEMLVISDLVGRWVTGEFRFVPPPLSRDVLVAIRRELERHVN